MSTDLVLIHHLPHLLYDVTQSVDILRDMKRLLYNFRNVEIFFSGVNIWNIFLFREISVAGC